MERLTHQGEHGPYWDKSVFDKHGGMEEDLIIDRLAYYENLEEQGRLVVLPCKVGTTIYTTRWWDDVPETCTDSKGKKFQRMIRRHKVTKDKFSPFGLDYIQFGEEVFLTREEAEAALRG